MNDDIRLTGIEEEPIYGYYGCCPEFGQCIEIFANDLRNANVGAKWTCEDQDRYPNRERNWEVEVKLVFRDDKGCLLIRHGEDDRLEEMVWIDLKR